MKWIDKEEIEEFLNKSDYDIRKTNNARWIDQKCTPDVLTIIADCILEYSNNNDNEYFSSIDIWHNKYTIDNVEAIFKKPKPNEEKARNEYDKFFQQPMELFAYAGILKKKEHTSRNYYKIANKELLEYISIREMNSLTFLKLYIEKVLNDSGIMNIFSSFFDNSNKYTYDNLKKEFGRFIVFNTPINGVTECNRIFTKVLNPLAFFRNSYGTKGGNISKNKITRDMLMYNRDNFRDLYSGKPKEMTRGEYLTIIKKKPNEELITYQSTKAKKLLKIFNDTFRNSKTEVFDEKHIYDIATHIHHIFPENEYKEISHYIENMIALTPTQHLNYAHQNGNTQLVNKTFQQLCLLAKSDSIEENLKYAKEKIYTFANFIYVLMVGLETDDFKDISDMDFKEINRLISNCYIIAND